MQPMFAPNARQRADIHSSPDKPLVAYSDDLPS
jgi:hypothetical protein